jgi:hypothetical protein
MMRKYARRGDAFMSGQYFHDFTPIDKIDKIDKMGAPV